MVSTYTTNLQLEEPARGDQVGTWDTPVNANMTLIDLVLGGRTAISLNNSPVVLATAQFQCKTITFNSTLTGNVPITFPTSFTKSYEIYNTCTGSSAFVITLQTTAAGGEVVCCPPGEIFEVINDGTNIRFKNFPRVGSYWDYAGSSVPAWVSGCTIPPYLLCDGTAFSSATYPVLAGLLGTTNRPDARGRARFSLNSGAGVLTTAGAGINGDSALAVGGSNGIILGTSHIPTLTSVNASQTIGITFTSSQQIPIGYWTGYAPAPTSGSAYVPYNTSPTAVSFASSIASQNSISVTYTNASQQILKATVPGYVGGITMIRSA